MQNTSTESDYPQLVKAEPAEEEDEEEVEGADVNGQGVQRGKDGTNSFEGKPLELEEVAWRAGSRPTNDAAA